MEEERTMEGAITGFLDYLQAEKGFSPNTIVAYRNDLSQLLGFIRSQHDGSAWPPPEYWGTVNASAIQGYYGHLQARGYAQTTVARKIASVKSFFNFLAHEQLIHANPTDGFASPGVRRALPKTVTPVEVGELLEQSAKRETPEARRDWTMLTLLYATGMRVTELVKLNVEDVILDSTYPYVRCVGRGARSRMIPLSAESIEPVHEYLNGARDRIVRRAGEPALFLNHRGERLTRQGFWLILKGYVRAANLREEITPHMLRHTFATHMLQSGRLNLRELQEFLGHASITTTQVYTQVAEQAAPPVVQDKASTPVSPAVVGSQPAARASAAPVKAGNRRN